jgi:hypothetical protein
VGYAREKLGMEPWEGQNGERGQLELFEAIGESARLQLAGQPATRIFRAPAGHGVGKTYGAAALVNWFFDAFRSSIVMTTAPTSNQVEKLLWKDIKSQRAGKNLPGRVLPAEPMMSKAANWFAYGLATSNAGGKGTERFQGQHNEFLFFVLDEAEGVPEFVFDAVNAMMTGGGVIICLMLANPRLRTSRFHRIGQKAGVETFRLSVLDHPNVVSGQDLIKGATTRTWAVSMIADHCHVVDAHDEDEFTFTLRWDVETDGGECLSAGTYPAGTIFQPDHEFLYRVMGIAPKNTDGHAFVSPGRYEAACKREAMDEDPTIARIGVDAARFGEDYGTIYVRHAGQVWRSARISQGDSFAYAGKVKAACEMLWQQGVSSVHVRVDGGGGYGAGPYDLIKSDIDLQAWFPDFQCFEVHNNGTPHDDATYADLVTEAYAEAAEALKGLRIDGAPPELEGDLTERLFGYAHKSGRTVKKLEPKDVFKKRQGRSPDDGDGLVLAVAPDYIFKPANAFVFGGY